MTGQERVADLRSGVHIVIEGEKSLNAGENGRQERSSCEVQNGGDLASSSPAKDKKKKKKKKKREAFLQ